MPGQSLGEAMEREGMGEGKDKSERERKREYIMKSFHMLV